MLAVPPLKTRPSIRRVLSVLLALAVVACSSDKRRAMEELRNRGIPANGPSVLRAVEGDDTETLGLLMTAGVYSGHRDSRGRTPLHVAVEEGRVAAAWMLIDGGADVNAGDGREVTPLSLAVIGEDAPLVARLLGAGATPDAATPDGSRLLPWAIRSGKVDAVRLLMENGADPHQKDAAGNPLLHVAMAAGRKELAMELIRLGADCGSADAQGESALVIALRNGWREQIGPLIRAGADPNGPDREGLTPFERAFRERDYALARELSAQGASPGGATLDRKLAEAHASGDRAASRWLLSFGADPSPEEGGECLIRRAVAEDDLDLLHLYFCYHPLPEGMLYEACRRGNRPLASLLIAHGANPNPSRAPFLDTPFSAALETGGDALASKLLEAGANPRGDGSHGVPPVYLAIAQGRPRVVEMLLEKSGIDVNAPLPSRLPESFIEEVKGATMRWLLRKDSRIAPLMLAVDSGSVETARILLERGARKHVWTRRNQTWPINIAARNDDVPMMRLLLDRDPYVEERHILVDLSEQQLRVFGTDGEEIYTTRVSTGKSGYRTRTGTFAITNRYRHWNSTIYGSSMPYFQRLSCSDFGFHQGYVPSYPASHGCIRVPAGNASKLFNILDLGDRVRIVP